MKGNLRKTTVKYFAIITIFAVNILIIIIIVILIKQLSFLYPMSVWIHHCCQFCYTQNHNCYHFLLLSHTLSRYFFYYDCRFIIDFICLSLPFFPFFVCISKFGKIETRLNSRWLYFPQAKTRLLLVFNNSRTNIFRIPYDLAE